jgi:hypothetical protein
MCEIYSRVLYSAMYYFNNVKPKKLLSIVPKHCNEENKTIINKIYKYTGYVNLLAENVSYVPNIEKDPNYSKQEYNRHIQKWIVRGHYRRTKNGHVWIDSHEKGEGALEKRVYGTVEEQDANVYPKTFNIITKVSPRGEKSPEYVNSTTPYLKFSDNGKTINKFDIDHEFLIAKETLQTELDKIFSKY